MTGPFFRAALRLLPFWVVGSAAPALAHDADVIFVEARDDADGTVEERLTLTANTLVALAPVDGDRDGLVTPEELERAGPAIAAGVWDDMPLFASGVACGRLASQARLAEGFVELQAKFTCGPGALSQTFKLLLVLPQNYRVVVGTQAEGERDRQAFARPLISGEIPRARGAEVHRVLGAAAIAGVRRAFAWPWLLFLLGWALLELPGGRMWSVLLVSLGTGALGAVTTALWVPPASVSLGVALGLFGVGLLVRNRAASSGAAITASIALGLGADGPALAALGGWCAAWLVTAAGAVPVWALARWLLAPPRLALARRVLAGAFLMAAGFEVAKLFRA